jgi:hypothetical protein
MQRLAHQLEHVGLAEEIAAIGSVKQPVAGDVDKVQAIGARPLLPDTVVTWAGVEHCSWNIHLVPTVQFRSTSPMRSLSGTHVGHELGRSP